MAHFRPMAAAIAIIGGLGLLALASELFVKGAGRLATRMRLSPLIVGVVVIGFGTSLPEALVSGLAAAQGLRQIAIGNVVGSNLANVTLILGVLAILAAPRITSNTLRREVPLATFAVLWFALLLQQDMSRLDGILLLTALGLILVLVIRLRSSDPEAPVSPRSVEGPVWVDALRTGGGLIGTIAGAHFLIQGAREVAEHMGLAEGFVGFTLVAVGTSLPELATCVSAVRHNAPDLALGNILGSNLFNSLGIGGLIGIVGPGRTDPALATAGAISMSIATVAVGYFMWTGRRITRLEGALLLVGYGVAVFLTGT